MANFNRSNRSGGGGNFRHRPTIHQAVCDRCGKECQVPFKPTSGKPIFCSDCFEKNVGSDSRRSGGRNFERPNFEEKRMFDTVCDNCGNNCKVPFQPRGDKPVYCSNCFESKGDGGSRNVEQFETLNSKLDKILSILMPIVSEEVPLEEKAKKAKKASKKTAPTEANLDS